MQNGGLVKGSCSHSPRGECRAPCSARNLIGLAIDVQAKRDPSWLQSRGGLLMLTTGVATLTCSGLQIRWIPAAAVRVA